MRYRTRPEVVEVKGPLDNNNAAEIARWCGGAVFDANPYEDWVDGPPKSGLGSIRGDTIRTGDYLVRHADGRFEPVRAVDFPNRFEHYPRIDD